MSANPIISISIKILFVCKILSNSLLIVYLKRLPAFTNEIIILCIRPNQKSIFGNDNLCNARTYYVVLDII